MSNSMTEVTEHFTHPGHKLVPLESNKEYLCGCCKTLGSGKTFRCSSCNDFNLHEFCGKCPQQLSTFMHPLHRLSLVVRKAQGTRTINRTCDVCEDDIEGFFYRCKDCDFDLHPVCTRLPQNLRHALHVDHPLVLQKSTLDAPCCVCKGICKSWRYRCEECDGFDIHLDCVLVVVSSTTTKNIQFAPPYTLQTPPQPPLHGGWVPPGNLSPYWPPPPLHGSWVPPGYYSPYNNMHNPGFVNNQAYMYNPVYHRHPGYAQAYNMYNPAFNMYNPAFNMYNPVYHHHPGYAQAYNDMYNPHAGTPLGSVPYNKYGNDNQDHHVGSAGEMQNCANHNHHHQGIGSNAKPSRSKRMFKLVGQLSLGVLSNVIFGVTFPGLSS